MLYYAVVFFVIALIAGVLGFGGIAGAAAGIAKILFFVFLVLFVLSLIMGRRAKLYAAFLSRPHDAPSQKRPRTDPVRGLFHALHASGNSTVKLAPPPSRSSYQTSPPMVRARCLASAKPRPVDDSPPVGCALRRT